MSGFSAIFPNPTAANQAVQAMAEMARQARAAGIPSASADMADSLGGGPLQSYSVRPTFMDYMRTFDRYGGTPYNQPPVNLLQRSLDQRERFVYGNQPYLTPLDFHYLVDRDPTARMVVEKPAYDAWSRLPVTYEKHADAFLAFIDSLNFRKHAAAAHKLANRDGVAFLYINASGDVTKPLPARAKWFGFEIIRAQQLAWPDPVFMAQPGEGTPLTAFHGIEYLIFHPVPTGSLLHDPEPAGVAGVPAGSSAANPTRGIQAQESPTAPDPAPVGAGTMYNTVTVHGSRIIPITPQVDAPTWLGESMLGPIYDDLRHLRDIIHAQRTAQFESDPIVVEVNIKDGFRIDDDEAAGLGEEFKQFSSGTRDAFSPLQGMTMKRLGPANLPDPDPIIRLLASRIAQGTPFTVNQVIASSRGSQQVTEADYQAYETNLTNWVRRLVCEPVLRQLFVLAQKSDIVRRRADVPLTFRWPRVWMLTEKEQALVTKNRATTFNMALSTGRLPPEDIMQEFPANEDDIDIKKVLGSRRLDVREELRGDIDAPYDGDGDGTPEGGAPAPPTQDSPKPGAKKA